jgi:hypothetical protein
MVHLFITNIIWILLVLISADALSRTPVSQMDAARPGDSQKLTQARNVM